MGKEALKLFDEYQVQGLYDKDDQK